MEEKKMPTPPTPPSGLRRMPAPPPRPARPVQPEVSEGKTNTLKAQPQQSVQNSNENKTPINPSVSVDTTGAKMVSLQPKVQEKVEEEVVEVFEKGKKADIKSIIYYIGIFVSLGLIALILFLILQ